MPMMSRLLFSARTQWIGFILGAVIVLIATLLPMQQIVSAPGSDKIHHILGFAFWASLCAFGPSKRFLGFALIIIACGGLIELIQPFVNRRAEWNDFWADVAGVASASVFHFLVIYLKRRGTDTA